MYHPNKKTSLFTGVAVWLAMSLWTPAGPVESVAPFVDDQTFAVVHLDLAHFEAGAMVSKVTEWAQKMSGEPASELVNLQPKLQRWHEEFRQAGGQSIFLVFSTYDTPAFFGVIPASEPAKLTALKNLAAAIGKDMQVPRLEQTIKDNYLLVGYPETLARVGTVQATRRPELAQAFESVAHSDLQAMVIPTADQRRVIQEMMPTLPIEGSTISGAVLTRGVLWVAGSGNWPPNIGSKTIIQSADNAAAQALKQFLGLLIPQMLAEARLKISADLPAKLNALLTPEVSQDRLVFDFPAAKVETFIELMAPAGLAARTRAKVIMSMNNVKQIVLAALMCQNDQKNWPASLEILAKSGSYLSNKEILKSPCQPNREIGYLYLAPGAKWEKYPVSEHIIIYEYHESWPANGITVGFLDGHTEQMNNEQRFKKLLSESQARIKAP